LFKSKVQSLQVESECQCEREKRAQAVAKETKEVRGARSFSTQTLFSMRTQMEARLTKMEKEEIERQKVFFLFCCIPFLPALLVRSRHLTLSCSAEKLVG
jgi:hypothetical protein